MEVFFYLETIYLEASIRSPRSRVFVAFCNDLFSRFEQHILFLEKLAETTDPTTDRHGHDGPSRGPRSKTLRILKFGY